MGNEGPAPAFSFIPHSGIPHSCRHSPFGFVVADNEDGCKLGFHTAGDGYRWSYRRYAAHGVMRASVVCVHGIQSHAGWYGHSCRRLAEAGFEVSFLDRRGSGHNETARGDTPSFRRLLDDIAEYIRAQRSQADHPFFVTGISWGAKLAV